MVVPSHMRCRSRRTQNAKRRERTRPSSDSLTNAQHVDVVSLSRPARSANPSHACHS
jgi:hypothetical protein